MFSTTKIAGLVQINKLKRVRLMFINVISTYATENLLMILKH